MQRSVTLTLDAEEALVLAVALERWASLAGRLAGPVDGPAKEGWVMEWERAFKLQCKLDHDCRSQAGWKL